MIPDSLSIQRALMLGGRMRGRCEREGRESPGSLASERPGRPRISWSPCGVARAEHRDMSPDHHHTRSTT